MTDSSASTPTPEVIEVLYPKSQRLGPLLNGAFVTRTEIPCPLCEAAGRKTNGGYTPRIRIYSGRTFCLSHGWTDPTETP